MITKNLCLSLLIGCWLLLFSTSKAQSNNPLDVAFGDPFVLYDQETDAYYMYGTGGVDNGFVAYSSKDLKQWENRGTVYTAQQDKSWGTKDFWAPEVY